MATFTNQAQLSYGNNVTVNSNIVTGEYLEVLSAVKSATSTTYTRSNEITYLLSLVNSGSQALTGISVTDNLGSYVFIPSAGSGITLTPLTYVTGSMLLYVNGIAQAAPTVTAAANSITVSNLSIPVGGNVLLLYRVLPNAYTPMTPGSAVTNIATVTGGGLAAPLTASSTLNVSPDPTLTISKSMSPLTVVENSTVTYTFVLENIGNTAAEAADNVALSDTFDPLLSGISVTLNGAPLAQEGNWDYDTDTGLFTTTPGILLIPAAQFTQNAQTGAYLMTPGYTTLAVTGTI